MPLTNGIAVVILMMVKCEANSFGALDKMRRYLVGHCAVALVLAGAAIIASTLPAAADFVTTTASTASTTTTTDTTTTTLDDPLHGYCSQCGIDNGTNTPTLDPHVKGFGFTVSPPYTSVGDLLVDILVPYIPNLSPTYTQYEITGQASTTSGNPNNKSVDKFATRTAVHNAIWTSGTLADFLAAHYSSGFTASPNNGIGAYLPSTSNFQSKATGYYVYQADLGQLFLDGPSGAGFSPFLNLLSQNLQLGSYIVGFFNEGTTRNPKWIATANSGAIFEGPEIDAASGSAAIALLLGLLALVSERRRALVA